jgi:transposase
MKYLEGLSRSQVVLFQEKLDDLVSENNPVRVIDEFVDMLDLWRLGFTKSFISPASPGAPSYSPNCLLKLYVFGCFKKVRSSRKLMEFAMTNIEAMWLLGRLTPDFRTISDFRKDNAKAIKKVFKAFVRVCVDMNIYSAETGVQDGSKFRAVNSKDNNVTESKLERKIKIAEEKLAKYLDELDKNDDEERDSQKYTKEDIEKKIAALTERKEEYNRLIEAMKEDGVTQISFTDPESKLMKMPNGGFNVCYNVQTLVDPVSHMIGDFDVTDSCNDMGLLSDMASKAKDDLGVALTDIVADKGYEDKADMLECLLNGTVPHVPSSSGEDSCSFNLDYKEATITEELLDSTKPEDIRTCLEAGAVPNVYAGKGVEAEVIEVEAVDPNSGALFTLSEDGESVTCPTGSVLNKVAVLNNKGKTRFACKSACKKCPEKCTRSPHKQVDLKDGQTVLHGKTGKSTITVKKVRIRLTPDRAKLRNRKCVVEHPFGTVKRWSDGSFTLLSGKVKVGADLALLFLQYNIKRAISMAGVRTMIERMREMGAVIERYFSGAPVFLGFLSKHPFCSRCCA